MNTSKSAGVYRLILSVLLIAMIIAVVAIAVDGWQTDSPNLPDHPPTDTTPEQPGEDLNDTLTPTPQKPTYTHYLSGLETTLEMSRRLPIVVAMHAEQKGYGLSSASVVIELPMEHGASRYLAFLPTADTLGQIGTVAPTRAYMSSLLRSFGGILVAYGHDDRIPSGGWDASGVTLDIYEKTGCAYTEQMTNVYTNAYLIGSGLESSAIQTEFESTPALPFTFTSPGEAAVRGDRTVTRVYLPYAQDNTTELVYREATDTYTLYKNGQAYVDLLTQGTATYTNAFVLFADATTYERTDMTETVIDTVSGGSGFYLTGGSLMRISWVCDGTGQMRLYDTAGRQLTVNRGSSYISFFKSSQSTSIHFE